VTIFYCIRFETPLTWRSRSPSLYPPGTEWTCYTPRHWVFFSSPPTTHMATVEEKVKVKVTLRLTVSHSLSLGVEAHIGLITRYLLLFNSYGLVLWGALSDETTGLSFVYAAGPHQRGLSRLRVPWGSCPYFTLSHLRLPFSSPPTTRRVTVEVFDPASVKVKVRIKVSYVTTDGQSASLSWNKAPIWGLRPDLYYCQTCGFVDMGRSL
jgi:hypothetical protein